MSRSSPPSSLRSASAWRRACIDSVGLVAHHGAYETFKHKQDECVKVVPRP